jgi:hypothetical protein
MSIMQIKMESFVLVELSDKLHFWPWFFNVWSHPFCNELKSYDDVIVYLPETLEFRGESRNMWWNTTLFLVTVHQVLFKVCFSSCNKLFKSRFAVSRESCLTKVVLLLLWKPRSRLIIAYCFTTWGPGSSFTHALWESKKRVYDHPCKCARCEMSESFWICPKKEIIFCL